MHTIIGYLEAHLPRYLPLILLVIALVIGVPMAYRAWKDAHEGDEESCTPDELLAEFAEAHAEGEIDDAEFARVSALLEARRGEPSVPERPKPRPGPSAGPEPSGPSEDAD